MSAVPSSCWQVVVEVELLPPPGIRMPHTEWHSVVSVFVRLSNVIEHHPLHVEESHELYIL